jgi:2-oxopent-4-enoate/cis-2-oxohex-4-enoate hydratase
MSATAVSARLKSILSKGKKINLEKIKPYADELYDALRSCKTIAPLTEREPSITIGDAYQISLCLLKSRQADGERLIGKKIGVTSKAVMDLLGVYQPDFGFLTDRMLFANGAALPVSTEMIQPRAEGEIAFRLKKSLCGPGVDEQAVIDATAAVYPCFEIVDSRIHDWKIKIQDTVADNASCGMFVLGDIGADPRQVDFVNCCAVVSKNGNVLSTGNGSAALGSPLASVAWLANTLAEYGVTLDAGDIVLSGSLVPLEPVKPGDRMRLKISGIGEASVDFV